MASYHECCFTELRKIMMNKITFVGFPGDNRSPPGSAPGTVQLPLNQMSKRHDTLIMTTA